MNNAQTVTSSQVINRVASEAYKLNAEGDALVKKYNDAGGPPNKLVAAVRCYQRANELNDKVINDLIARLKAAGGAA